MKTFFSNKRAFSLPEVIVAFSVLVTVIFASTNLLVAIIRSNTENENTLVAYGLAQEGLEAFRNIRDSNWLLGADFQGQFGNTCLWPGECLSKTVGDKEDYAISLHGAMTSSGSAVKSAEIAGYAPWELKKVTPNAGGQIDLTATRLYIGQISDLFANAIPGNHVVNGPVWYQHCFTGCQLPPSLFSRYVEVTPLSYDNGTAGKVYKYNVSSVVKWVEQGRDKEVRLTTELTDWKGGPL